MLFGHEWNAQGKVSKAPSPDSRKIDHRNLQSATAKLKEVYNTIIQDDKIFRRSKKGNQQKEAN